MKAQTSILVCPTSLSTPALIRKQASFTVLWMLRPVDLTEKNVTEITTEFETFCYLSHSGTRYDENYVYDEAPV